MEGDDQALRVLVVDDNRSAATAAALLLRREGHEVLALNDGAAAIEALEAQHFDLVLTDLRMEPIDGLSVVRAARACHPPVEAIVLTAYGSVDTAVEAMRLGALDFLTKPVAAEQLVQRVRDYRRGPTGELALIGDSPEATALREKASRLVAVRSTVLITGEAGAGRRHFARWLHAQGPDGDRPLVRIQPGRAPGIAVDQGGTLLIENIDNWSLSAQAALLDLLQEIEPGRPPRVVATASPALAQRVAEGDVLSELYFRLAVLVVDLQPLRRRPDDVSPLLRHLLDKQARAFGREAPRPSLAQLDALTAHAWPGNVRELANLAERAVVLGPSAFDLDGRPKPAAPQAAAPQPATLEEGFDLAEHLASRKRELLEAAVARSGGDIRVMSRLLGMERARLRYRLEKYGLLDRA